MLNHCILATARQNLGKAAEALAAQYLQEQGFTIVARNYRYRRAEIDLIAQKDRLLLFVEVKARSSDKFGYPEAFVSSHQQALLQEGAEEYMMRHNWHEAIRFDIMAVYHQGGQLTLRHFEDAF